MKIKFMRKLLMHARSFQFSRDPTQYSQVAFLIKSKRKIELFMQDAENGKETRLLNNKFRLLTEKVLT
jgi:hypothetical protein